MNEFREMRRSGQKLTKERCYEILDGATHGVLALSGDGGYPYALPISFVRCGETLYFHSAAEGHKIDAIKRCDKASFCVVAEDRVAPEKYTTLYESAIVFGRIKIVADDSEKLSAIEALSEKYYPGGPHRKKALDGFDRFVIIRLDAEEISGKASKYLLAERETGDIG